MCIGIPMRVVSIADGIAVCEGRGRTDRLNALLVGDALPGTWVLAFQGAAVRTLSDEEAAQTGAALEALEAVMRGETDLAGHFADLIDREPELPAHLRGSP